MAINDVRIKDSYVSVPVREYQVAAAATLIYPGEPVKLSAAGAVDVIKLADNEPVIGTTTQLCGIAASLSTNTAAAAGKVNVYVLLPEVVYECAATTPANIDTQAKLDALVGDNVLFDLTSTTFTVDENAGNAATSGLQIVGGDPKRGLIYFIVRPSATFGAIA